MEYFCLPAVIMSHVLSRGKHMLELSYAKMSKEKDVIIKKKVRKNLSTPEENLLLDVESVDFSVLCTGNFHG